VRCFPARNDVDKRQARVYRCDAVIFLSFFFLERAKFKEARCTCEFGVRGRARYARPTTPSSKKKTEKGRREEKEKKKLKIGRDADTNKSQKHNNRESKREREREREKRQRSEMKRRRDI